MIKQRNLKTLFIVICVLVLTLFACCKKKSKRVVFKPNMYIKSMDVERCNDSITIISNEVNSKQNSTCQKAIWHFYKYNGKYYTDDKGLKSQVVMSNSVVNMPYVYRHTGKYLIGITINKDPLLKSLFNTTITQFDSCGEVIRFIIIKYDKSYSIKSISISSDSNKYYPAF